MTKSMTGYGKGVLVTEQYTITVETKSVNHRFFECIVRLPRTLLSAEDSIKKLYQEHLNRGRVEVFVTVTYSESKPKKVSMNWDLFSQLESVAKAAKERSDLFDNLDVSTILFHPDVLQIEETNAEDSSLLANILKAAHDALKNLQQMREREGSQLKNYFYNAIIEMEKYCNEIKVFVPNEEQRQYVRLKQKLDDLELDISDESRLLTEVALLVEKLDITEEITRLYSHVEQLKETLTLIEPIGRKLDFLLQECNREVNTIASKTASIHIKKLAISMKSELEKMREQVQNIE